MQGHRVATFGRVRTEMKELQQLRNQVFLIEIVGTVDGGNGEFEIRCPAAGQRFSYEFLRCAQNGLALGPRPTTMSASR